MRLNPNDARPAYTTRYQTLSCHGYRVFLNWREQGGSIESREL